MGLGDRVRDHVGRDRTSVEYVQSISLVVVFSMFAVVLLSVVAGLLSVALYALAVALTAMGGLQLAFPETMVRISRQGSLSAGTPTGEVADVELWSKRAGGVLLVGAGVALVVFEDAILAFF